MPHQIRISAGDNLEAIIRSAPAGTKVVLSPGRYDGNVVINKPLEITGDESGGTVTLSAQSGTCLRVTSPQTLIWGIRLEASSRSVTLLDIETSNVAVDDCTLSGGKTTVRISGQNITLQRCMLLNGTTGLHLDQRKNVDTADCKDVDIVDCTIREHRDTGVLCTNLGTGIQLVACELCDNKRYGLSTSYFSHYLTVWGPTLHRCSIHHNGINGVRIVDPAWSTSIEQCRIFDNGDAQIYLGVVAHVDWCDISGGKTGITIIGADEDRGPGGHSWLRDSKIHDLPTGVVITDPNKKVNDPVLMHSMHIYNTTVAANRCSNNGALTMLWCVLRDNTGAGVLIDTGGKQQVRESRIIRNSVGVLIQEGGYGQVKASIIDHNGTGIDVRPNGHGSFSYSRIEDNLISGMLVHADAEGNISDCAIRNNAFYNLHSDPAANLLFSGDPSIDHLARRMSWPSSKDMRIPDE
jgi:nitrous oxidase accessory protein NosD